MNHQIATFGISSPSWIRSTCRRLRILPRWPRRSIAMVAVMGLATMMGVSGTAAAESATESVAATQTVISGHARFQVLSPTLIRMEYAGADSFTDGATFNAIGRDGFTATPFTQSVAGGWLTIDTGSITLRYLEGSGPFSAANVSATLTAGGQVVTAHPEFTSTEACGLNTICEAETATLSGVSVGTDHTGYTGSGFAAGFETPGNSVTFDVNLPPAGSYDLQVRYANAHDGSRSLAASFDGAESIPVAMPRLATRDTWGTAVVSTGTLGAGRHTLVVSRPDDGTTLGVNIDSVALTEPGAPYPSSTPVKPCAFGSVCEAGQGQLAVGTTPLTSSRERR